MTSIMNNSLSSTRIFSAKCFCKCSHERRLNYLVSLQRKEKHRAGYKKTNRVLFTWNSNPCTSNFRPSASVSESSTRQLGFEQHHAPPWGGISPRQGTTTPRKFPCFSSTATGKRLRAVCAPCSHQTKRLDLFRALIS